MNKSEMHTNPPNAQSAILTDKEWLDLYWKYFQQHAQQRISYFNFFVVFSTILTTAYIGTFQKNFGLPSLGLGIGFVQLFVAFIFIKIDMRNSYLIKHAESAIKTLEKENAAELKFPLFTLEEVNNNLLQEERKKLFALFQPFTHGKSFRWIYSFFMLVGFTELILSPVFLKFDKKEAENIPPVYNIMIYQSKADTLNNTNLTGDTLSLIIPKMNPVK